ncbi:S16 family serine protease [Streptomyces sp. DSM 44915]|uniref:S16 family serine protease n=1 Tax=Streptomyces chisholmiae TaxID=3075540 RepID=A0ABU2JS97_9ACTN|nr:S16 family serine protease [Streptomyces sp. DSM 44915]MDT0267870.1 S16 family serine protease [Streptomyces sp. DSM 44915]
MPAAPPASKAPASPADKAPPERRRRWVLAGCGAAFAALLGVTALAPLPFVVTEPGMTADVLGEHADEPVIRISGAETRPVSGELRMTTINATSPGETVRLADVLGGYLAGDRAVLPSESVYPVGESPEEITEHNETQMRRSQDAATAAALGFLDRADEGIEVSLELSDVGGPSAGLLFALGVVALLDAGDELTGGAVVAGTGTIDADGTVGAVGGVALKTHAARQDGATVFLVPRDECPAAEGNAPDGLRLVPVDDLAGAVTALRALAAGDDGAVPGC